MRPYRRARVLPARNPHIQESRGTPNVIMTPHISGSDLGPLFTERMTEILLHNTRQFLAGGRLWNELTAEELSGRT